MEPHVVERLNGALHFYFTLACDGNGNLITSEGNKIERGEIQRRNIRIYDVQNGIEMWSYYFQSNMVLSLNFKVNTKRSSGQFAIDLISISTCGDIVLSINRDYIILHWPDIIPCYMEYQKFNIENNYDDYEMHGDYHEYDTKIYDEIINVPIILDTRFKKNSTDGQPLFHAITVCNIKSSFHNNGRGYKSIWKLGKLEIDNSEYNKCIIVSVFKTSENQDLYKWYDISAHWENNYSRNQTYYELVPKKVILYNTLHVDNFRNKHPEHMMFTQRYDHIPELELLESDGLTYFDNIRMQTLRFLLDDVSIKSKIKDTIGWVGSDDDFDSYLHQSIEHPWRFTTKSYIDRHLGLWNMFVNHFCKETHTFDAVYDEYKVPDISETFRSVSIHIRKTKTSSTVERNILWDGSITQRIKITRDFPWSKTPHLHHDISSLQDMAAAVIPSHKSIPIEIQEQLNNNNTRI